AGRRGAEYGPVGACRRGIGCPPGHRARAGPGRSPGSDNLGRRVGKTVIRVKQLLATPGRPAATTWLAWLLPVFAWAPLTYPGYFEFLSGFAPVFNLDAYLQAGL